MAISPTILSFFNLGADVPQDQFRAWAQSVEAEVNAQGAGASLSATPAADNVLFGLSPGNGATLPAATNVAAGAMTAADVIKLGAIETGATADQTATEIINLINAEIGTTWQGGGGGGGGSAVNDNLLINGRFRINQRVFAGGALAAGVYGYDRWKAGSAGANVSVNAGGVVTLTSGQIEQHVELPFWGIASGASTSFTLSVSDPSTNISVTIGGTTGVILTGSGRRSVTLTAGAGVTTTLVVTMAPTAGAVTFSDVKLELGATVSAFVPRTVQAELLLAQRYFKRFTSLYFEVIGTGAWQAASIAAIGFVFVVPMRVAPTVAVTTPSAYVVQSNGGYVQVSNITVQNMAATAGLLNITPVSNGTTGQGTVLVGHYENGHINLSAEI